MVGQFKDDQLQEISGESNLGCSSGTHSGVFKDSDTFTNINSYSYATSTWTKLNFKASNGGARTGTTTHSKQKGVTYIVKVL